MKIFRTPPVCLVLLILAGCSTDPETLVRDGYDEAEMASATARAIAEVDDFIADLSSGQSQNYAVKAPIQDGNQTEHFWLTGVTFADGKFTGTIDNDPGMVTNVKIGQQWTIEKSEISDWMYMRDGKMHGNYTMRPLLATLPREEAEEYRSMFARP